MTREYILQEIQRLAEANGGVPLGRQRFARETGIKEAEWLGRYWARWGDAVEEAGFRPNEFQGAYSEIAIVRRYLELIQELGRIPVESELRMKARTDPTFPSHTVFSRLGPKPSRVAKVLELCRSGQASEDVRQLCESYLANLGGNQVVRIEPELAPEQDGFVYLLKAGRHYKIGRTNAIGRRERELAIQLPERATTVHTIRTDDPAGIEAYWHRRFADRRKNGEWFDLSAADVTAFRKRRFM